MLRKNSLFQNLRKTLLLYKNEEKTKILFENRMDDCMHSIFNCSDLPTPYFVQDFNSNLIDSARCKKRKNINFSSNAFLDQPNFWAKTQSVTIFGPLGSKIGLDRINFVSKLIRIWVQPKYLLNKPERTWFFIQVVGLGPKDIKFGCVGP